MIAWANIKTIAKREIGGYFASPVAYVFIVIFLLLAGFFTFMLGGFFERREASLVSFFLWHPWLYLFLVPAVGMRLWSEERRLGTMELLLTMPVTAWQAIVGKFLASWLFLGLALFLTFPVVITVNYLGNADLGVIFCGYIGSLLLAGAYLAHRLNEKPDVAFRHAMARLQQAIAASGDSKLLVTLSPSGSR